MSTAFSRILMHLLTVAFLLLLPSDTIGRAGTLVRRHHSSPPSVAAANRGALLATSHETTTQRKDVESARPELLASDASLHDRRAQSAPAPTRHSVSLRSYERTPDQIGR